MEIHQLRTFLAVAKHGGISPAARQLLATPPSASAHLKALEDELGVALFARQRHRLRLTAAGEALRSKAQHLLQTADEIAAEAVRLKGQIAGQVAIGLNTDPAVLRVADITHRLRRLDRSIEVIFLSSDSSTVVDRLRTGELDAGFVYAHSDYNGLAFEELTTVELVVVIPACWPATPEPGNWSALALHPWIYTTCHCPFQQVVDREMRHHHLACRGEVQAADEATRRELVRTGAGVAVLERSDALRLEKEGTAQIWPSATKLTCPLYFAIPSHAPMHPAMRAVADAVGMAWNKKIFAGITAPQRAHVDVLS